MKKKRKKKMNKKNGILEPETLLECLHYFRVLQCQLAIQLHDVMIPSKKKRMLEAKEIEESQMDGIVEVCRCCCFACLLFVICFCNFVFFLFFSRVLNIFSKNIRSHHFSHHSSTHTHTHTHTHSHTTTYDQVLEPILTKAVISIADLSPLSDNKKYFIIRSKLVEG